MGLIGPRLIPKTKCLRDKPVLLLDMRLPDPARQLPNANHHTEANLGVSASIGSFKLARTTSDWKEKLEAFPTSP